MDRLQIIIVVWRSFEPHMNSGVQHRFLNPAIFEGDLLTQFIHLIGIISYYIHISRLSTCERDSSLIIMTTSSVLRHTSVCSLIIPPQAGNSVTAEEQYI